MVCSFLLLHDHVLVIGQGLQGCGGQGLIPVGHGGVVVVPGAGPAQVVQSHPEVLFKVDGVGNVEAVQQKPLLTVIEGFIVAHDGIHTAVQAAEGLVFANVDVISEAVAAAEIVLGAGAADGGEFVVAVHVELDLAFSPPAVVVATSTTSSSSDVCEAVSTASISVVEHNYMFLL